MIEVETERLRLRPWRAKDYGPFAAYYAAEACRRAIDVAKHTLNAPSLVSYIDPANTPSIKLAQRLGAFHDDTIELATFGPHRVYRHY